MVTQLVQKFHCFHKAEKFIYVLTKAYHFTQYSAN
jgi:hypothetical protein